MHKNRCKNKFSCASRKVKKKAGLFTCGMQVRFLALDTSEWLHIPLDSDHPGRRL